MTQELVCLERALGGGEAEPVLDEHGLGGDEAEELVLAVGGEVAVFWAGFGGDFGF